MFPVFFLKYRELVFFKLCPVDYFIIRFNEPDLWGAKPFGLRSKKIKIKTKFEEKKKKHAVSALPQSSLLPDQSGTQKYNSHSFLRIFLFLNANCPVNIILSISDENFEQRVLLQLSFLHQRQNGANILACLYASIIN